jgi:hypothetical protein
MGFRVIGNLKAHARAQGERASILEFSAQFSGEAKQNVSFDAPMVCDIAGRTLDDPNSDVAELPGPPGRRASLAWMECLSIRSRRKAHRESSSTST